MEDGPLYHFARGWDCSKTGLIDLLVRANRTAWIKPQGERASWSGSAQPSVCIEQTAILPKGGFLRLHEPEERVK